MFQGLVVLNQRKQATTTAAAALPAPVVPASAWSLETCQRHIWAYKVIDAESRALSGAPGLSSEVYRGADAYAYLISVAAGLESEMLGETEVLGQVKDAWNNYRAGAAHGQAQALQPLFQKLFEDVKTIRTQYLRHIGNCSYGSLVRRVLGETPLKGSVLLVGAGALAESVAPWLAGSPLTIVNRPASRAEELAESLVGCCDKPGPLHTQPPKIAALDHDWRSHSHVVLCVPPGDEVIARRLAQWAATATSQCRFFDLSDKSHGIPGAITLQHLFALQNEQKSLQDIEIQKARRAVKDIAARREAEATYTFTHGWEDLWSFGA